MDALHVCLNVSDADRLAEWYQSELGFDHSWEFISEDGSTRNVYVADGNGFELQLSDTDGEDDLQHGSSWDHFAVKVENVDAAFETIDNHGVVQEPAEKPEASARTAFIEDPDGHVVELIEPLETAD